VSGAGKAPTRKDPPEPFEGAKPEAPKPPTAQRDLEEVQEHRQEKPDPQIDPSDRSDLVEASRAMLGVVNRILGQDESPEER
jgi:hypothetical protein